MKKIDPEFRWSSIQVNVNTVADVHTDHNNYGPSYLLAGGGYTGGELCLYEESKNQSGPGGSGIVRLKDGKYYKTKGYDLRTHAVKFDGRKWHSSETFKGTRVSFVLFTHSSIPQIHPESFGDGPWSLRTSKHL